MDFLLECIGFPPDYDLRELADRIADSGEPAVWRGHPDLHRRLPLGGGLELRMDRETDRGLWSILPHFQTHHRLRIAVNGLRSIPDSPFDALLSGWVAPPVEPLLETGLIPDTPGAYPLTVFLTDARRLPRSLKPGHVLAVSAAGFALDVESVGPNSSASKPAVLEEPSGAYIEPLGGPLDPGGCAELSVRIRSIRHLWNPITGERVDLLDVDAPERPLQVFVSPWQLEQDDLPAPRPGWRIEGTFLFSGRIAGGLPRKRVGRRAFG